MARIGKAEHARILHLADVEQRRVADIAAEYGCSAANIYTLLSRLRRAAATVEPPSPAAAPMPEAPVPVTPVIDLFAAPAAAAPKVEARVAPPPPPSRPAPRAPAPGRPGYGLVMRSPEGEESLAPFRSLDDLLGAVKPILRAAASSSEPVWFCIQPVDLATLDEDAA